MSKEIDERVVSMQFDNALFEKNIQKSLKSIDDLNKSLNNLDGAKGLEEVSKAAKEVDLTPIIASAKNAEKSFSALEIAGITTISRLTNSLINFGAKMGKNFWDSTIGQIKSGGWKRASDIKAGKFMLEGLGLGDKNVELLSEAAQKAVKGTAAGLGEAMKAAGVMATSGLKDAKKMESTLRGIAGVSAMTGRSFENIANIYSTVASNGKLMTMQLRQFSFAGINVAAKLAEAMGTTEEAVNQMVTKGQIDFETFSKIMSDTFGPHALDANKTFEGALANMKAALSRIGESFATPFMDNAKDVFNVLRVFFDSVNEAMAPIEEDFKKLMTLGNDFIHKVFSPFVEKVTDLEGNVKWQAKESKVLDNIAAAVRNIYTTVVLIFDTFAEAVREVFPPLEDTTDTFKEFTASLVPTADGLKTLKFVFKVILIVIKQITDTLGTLVKIGTRVFTVLFTVANKLLGVFGFLDDGTSSLFEKLKNFKILETIIDVICLGMIGIGSAIIGVISLIGKLFDKIKKLISFDDVKKIGINIINGIVIGLRAGFDLLKKVWNGIIQFLPDSIEKALQIASPSKLMKRIGIFIMAGLAAGLLIGKTEITSFITGLGEVFGSLISTAISFAEIIGTSVVKAFNKLTDSVKSFNKQADKESTDNLEDKIEKVQTAAKGSTHGYDKSTTYAMQEITVVQGALKDTFTKNNDDMVNSQEKLTDTVDKSVPSILDRIKEFVSGIDTTTMALIILGTTLFGTIGTQITAQGSALTKIALIIAGITGAVYLFKKFDVGTILKNTTDAIKAFFSGISSTINANPKMQEFNTFLEGIKNTFKNINFVALAGKAMAMSFAIAIIGLIINITKLATSLTTGIKKLVSAIENLTTISLGFKETVADRLVKIALSFAVIALAVVKLGDIAEGGHLQEALNATYQLMGIFVAMTLAISAIEKYSGKESKSVNQLSKTIMAFALMCSSLIILSAILARVEPDAEMLFSMFLIGAIFVGFLEVLKRIQLAGDMNINVSMKTMLGLAAAIMALGTVVTGIALALSNFKSVGSMIGAAIAASLMISAIMGMMALLINVMKDFKKFKGMEMTEKTMPENVKILISLSVFLMAFASFMKILSTIPLEGVGPMVGGAIMAVLAMVGFATILHFFRDDFMKLSDDISKLAGDMLKIAAAMYILANLRMEQFQLALERVTDIVITLEAITYTFSLIRAGVITLSKSVKAFNKAGEQLEKEKGDKLTNTVWAFGFALASLAVALGALGLIFTLMPKERLAGFAVWTTVLITILAAMNVIIAALNNKKSGDTGSAKQQALGIALVIGAISTMLISMIVLSLIPWYDLLAPLGSVVLLLVVFSSIFKELGHMNKYTKNALGPLIALAGIMVALTALMITIGVIPNAWQGAIAAAFGVAAVFAAIALIFKTIQGNRLLKIDPTVLVMTVILTLFMAAIGGLIYALSTLPDPYAALNTAVGIGAMLLALAAAISIMSDKKIDPSALLSLVMVGGILLGLVLALKSLSEVDGGKILTVAGAISAIILVLTLFTFTLGKLGPILTASTIGLAAFGAMFMQIGASILMMGIGISAVILSVSLAFNLITFAISQLEKIDLKKVGDGLGEVAAGVIKLGLAFAGAALAMSVGLAALGAVLSFMVTKLGAILFGIGVMIMTGLGLGIKKSTKNATNAMEGACTSVINIACKTVEVHSPSEKFRWIGDQLMKGLALGIVEKIPFVGDKLKAGLESLIQTCYNYADKFEEVGDDWSKLPEVFLGDKFDFGNIADGVLDIDSILEKYGLNADDAASSTNDLADAFEDMGASAGTASNGVDTLKNNISQALDMFTEFDSTAIMTGKDVIRSFQSQLEGVSKWSDELQSLSARGLGEVIIQDLASLGPQAYEKVHAFYTMTNSELAMMNIMYKQKLALQNGTSKKIAKSFGKLTDDVTDELKDGINEMGDTLTDSVTDMAGNMMKALKKQMDYEKVINQVTGFRDNVADKIRSSMSIFEAVNEQEEIKAEELLKNMKDQVKHVGKWASMITEMAAKGFDEGLVATLTEMGPQSYSKVAAFLTMSEEQIAEANRLYEASEQVPEYGADKIVKAFAQAGFTASMGLTDSFLEGLDPEAVEQAMEDIGQRSITSLQEEIANKPYEIGELIPSDFANGLVAAVEEETGRVKEAMQELADAANIENYLPTVGNEDLAADQIKAYGSKAVEEARKANSVNDESNRAVWAERDKNKYNQIYQEEQKKSYTQNKNYDFIYKTSSGGNKKLHDLLYAQYGESMYSFVEQIYDETGKLINEYYDFGKLLSTGILQDNTADEALKKYLRVIVDNAQGNIDSMGYYDLGKNIAFTTSNGVEESTKYMSDAGDALMASELGGMAGDSRYATKKVKDIVRADIKSMPIGKGLIEFGAGIGDSTAEGINTEGVVAMEEAGQNLAGSFIISLRDNLASLMDAILNSDDTTTPKIKPVIDGSNMFDGIKSLLNKNPIDLSGSASIDVSTKNRDKSVVDAINGISNKEVVDAVNDLAAIVDMFRGQATSLQVVMDTGQTIGALGHPMDLYLGQQSKFAGRGM